MSNFSVTCSMSLAYLLSILLLYSCFYTLHIPYSFYDLLLSMFYYIFFHILLYFYILSIFFMSSYTVFLVLVMVYYHRIAVLCFSYHIIYFIHFLYLYFSFSFMFIPANTLAADTGNNCMYPKVFSLYEIVISICIYPKVSSLYETVTYACNDPNGIYVIDPNGTSISVNCMLQQLCPYRHAYLSLYQVLSRQSILLHFLYISHLHE